MRLITLLLTAVLGTGLLGSPPQAATAATGAATAAATSRAVGAPRARPHGRWLLDPQGRVLVLHGLNMVYKRAPYAPDAEGFGRDDARFLARNGFTTVRLGLIWKAVEPSPGEYDDAYLARIRRTAQLLAREGIWTLLDFHQDLFNERFQGEGAPDWAVQDDGLPAEPQAGFPANYFGMPALNRAFDHFWADDPGPAGSASRTGTPPRGRTSRRTLRDPAGARPRRLQRALAGQPVGAVRQPRRLSGLRRQPAGVHPAGDRRGPGRRPADRGVLRAAGAVQQRVADLRRARRRKRLGFSFHDYCLTADAGAGESGPAGLRPGRRPGLVERRGPRGRVR